jgi:hypothetical protein
MILPIHHDLYSRRSRPPATAVTRPGRDGAGMMIVCLSQDISAPSRPYGSCVS